MIDKPVVLGVEEKNKRFRTKKLRILFLAVGAGICTAAAVWYFGSGPKIRGLAVIAGVPVAIAAYTAFRPQDHRMRLRRRIPRSISERFAK